MLVSERGGVSMVKGLFGVALGCVSIGAPIVKEAVTYNDSNYEIVLSSDEANNYTFVNLFTYIEGVDNSDISFAYNNEEYTWDSTFNCYSKGSGDVYLYLISSTYKFQYDVNQSASAFEDNLTVYAESSLYPDIKQVIEADIEANTIDNNVSMPSVSDLFGYITQGVTSFVQSLGQAFTSVTALFWTTGENAGPTFVGMLMLVSIGAGLIYLAFSLIRGLVRRLRG